MSEYRKVICQVHSGNKAKRILITINERQTYSCIGRVTTQALILEDHQNAVHSVIIF